MADRERQHCLVIWNEESLRVLELEHGLAPSVSSDTSMCQRSKLGGAGMERGGGYDINKNLIAFECHE